MNPGMLSADAMAVRGDRIVAIENDAELLAAIGDDSVRTGGRQWDAVWDDGDFFKAGFNTQGIYVSPARDLVIAYFPFEPTQQIQKYLRPLVKSGLFE